MKGFLIFIALCVVSRVVYIQSQVVPTGVGKLKTRLILRYGIQAISEMARACQQVLKPNNAGNKTTTDETKSPVIRSFIDVNKQDSLGPKA